MWRGDVSRGNVRGDVGGDVRAGVRGYVSVCERKRMFKRKERIH